MIKHQHIKLFARSLNTNALITKTKPSFDEHHQPDDVNISVPESHVFKTKRFLDRYLVYPKTIPEIVYDYTSDLQLVKPYYVRINTRIGKANKNQTLHEFVNSRSYFPMPHRQKSQFLTTKLESGDYIVDGNVIPPTKKLTHYNVVTSKRHRHEDPVPRIDPDTLCLHSGPAGLKFVDKPGGLPCVMNKKHTFNTMQLMLYLYLGVRKRYCMFNDLAYGSGVVILCKDFNQARILLHSQVSGKIQFEYKLRVFGRFPSSTQQINFNPMSEDPCNTGKVRYLSYDVTTDTTLLSLQSYSPTPKDIYTMFGSLSYPVVNDWEHARSLHPYLTTQFNVNRGYPKVDDVHARTKCITELQDIPPKCTIMPDLTTANRDHVVKLPNTNISQELRRYYRDCQEVLSAQDRLKNCPFCLTQKLPLPVELMSPRLHLLSVTSPAFTFQSKLALDWLE